MDFKSCIAWTFKLWSLASVGSFIILDLGSKIMARPPNSTFSIFENPTRSHNLFKIQICKIGFRTIHLVFYSYPKTNFWLEQRPSNSFDCSGTKIHSMFLGEVMLKIQCRLLLPYGPYHR